MIKLLFFLFKILMIITLGMLSQIFLLLLCLLMWDKQFFKIAGDIPDMIWDKKL